MPTYQRWDPSTFLARMRATVPDYERLQDETVRASGSGATRVLELGTGTGETTRRALAQHPTAFLIGIDADAAILEHARAALPADRTEFRVARLQDPLPDGQFDLVLSTLAIHHLDGAEKADLFQRIADRLTSGGRFVVGDFAAVDDPAVATVLDPKYDKPSTVADQLHWINRTGLRAHVVWTHRDLAVLVGRSTKPEIALHSRRWY